MKRSIIFLSVIISGLWLNVAQAEDCMKDPITPQDWNAKVTTGMRLRDIPCMESSKVLTTVPVGQIVKVIAVTDGYYQVRLNNGVEGWVGQWLVARTDDSFQSSTPTPVQVTQAKEALYDIKNHRSEEAIRYLAAAKIVQGYPDGSFLPDKVVNRAEFVKILVGAITDSVPARPTQKCFPDVNNAEWFAPYICYAKEKGLIGGYPDGKFKPAETINLVEAAKILVNANQLVIKSDIPKEPWYRPFIETLQNSNYLPSTFSDFNQKVQRGQMSEMIWRILEKKTNLDNHQFYFSKSPVVADNAVSRAQICPVPAEASAVDTSAPDQVIGDGTAASCTSQAVINAVAKGGKIVFNCGPKPVTIKMSATAKIFNDQKPDVVIDGGNLVTLDGQNKQRILYQNTCDQNQVWTTPHCDNQATPRLTVQNITLINGNSSSDDQGGGAIFARGGQLKIVNSKFYNNVCNSTGPDIGGGAVRAFDQFNDQPLYVVNSVFGGESGRGNTCSNGGALSSIGVSYSIFNSLFSYNTAIGNGANPAQAGTPGGGSGGAIYNDGNTFNLKICGSEIKNNTANEGGGAIFFVSNDRSGKLNIQKSLLSDNPSKKFETDGLPGIFYLGSGEASTTDSTLK